MAETTPVPPTGADRAAPTGAGPVRFGFLGAGMISTVALAPAVHASAGAVLQAAAARELARAAALQPVRSYGSYPDLLADEEVEVVYVALPNDAHLPWTLAALAAGKHVLCEKPLALSAAEVDQMAAAARAADRRVVEASWYRWHPRTRRAQELLAEGAIGPVRHVTAGFTFPGVAPGNYRLEPGRGGGALYDVGCYAVSAALWSVGLPPSRVAAQHLIGPTGVDLTAELVVEFPAGATAEVRASIAEPERQWLRITGEAGEIEFEQAAFTAWRSPCTLSVSDGKRTRREAFAPVDPYLLMVDAVAAAVRAEPAFLVDMSESRAVAAVLDQALPAGE